MTTPEQIDRDAAIDALSRVRGYGVKIGDNHHLVQAFAAHRLVGVQQGRDEATAEIVAWLRHGLSATWPQRSRYEIADAIEHGEHLKAKG